MFLRLLFYEIPAFGLVFGLGLLVGSFLNVCISRMPLGESVVRPRSRCMRCGHPVRWYDNVPVVSWAVLGGRCRDCRAGISWRYLAVEVAAGVWAVVVLQRLAGDWLGFFGSFPALLLEPLVLLRVMEVEVLGFLLIGLIVIDWRHQILPDTLTLPGIAAGMFLVCTEAIFLGPGEGDIHLNPRHSLRMSSPGSTMAKGTMFLTGPEHLIFGRLGAVVGAAMVLLVVRWVYRALRGREGLGLGDVKMLAMIGAFLGFWPAMLAMFVGVMFGAVYAVYLLARGRAGAGTRLPFGSFLGAGGLVAGVFGPGILRWYGSLL